MSRAVYDHLRNRLSLPFEPLEELHLKNIAAPVERFVLRLDPATLGRGRKGVRVRPILRPVLLGVVALLAIEVAVGGWRAWY